MIDNNSTVTSKFGVQKIGKGKSPVLPKEKDPSFNLRDRLNDVLINEKHMIDSYNIGQNELFDEQLYNQVTKNIGNVKLIQRSMLEQLFNLGEYQADTATPQQINDAFDVFNNYQVQLPYKQQSNNQQ